MARWRKDKPPEEADTLESVLALIPEEERVSYSAMTGQSLFYMGESDRKHKILAIVEEEGAEGLARAREVHGLEVLAHRLGDRLQAGIGRLRGRPRVH